ncbi:MAG: hypothetical protein DMG62_01590 [Acidobacteria bacterium]|nr:MAG: hypothetical protein DMG62_01590 [Acidobacteriota bacterium]
MHISTLYRPGAAGTTQARRYAPAVAVAALPLTVLWNRSRGRAANEDRGVKGAGSRLLALTVQQLPQDAIYFLQASLFGGLRF